MIDESLRKLIEFLETASPHVWEVLVKQVYVSAFERLFWSIVLLFGAYVFKKVGDKGQAMKEESYHNDWEGLVFLGYVGSVICVVLALLGLSGAFTRFANPEFYAIRYILLQLTP